MSRWVPRRSLESIELILVASGISITNMLAAETEFFAPRFRAIADLTCITRVRLIVGVGTVGAVGSVMRLQWSVDQVVWHEFAPTNQPEIPLTLSALVDSGWVTVPGGARQEIFHRLVTAGGDGIADPSIGHVGVLCQIGS